MARPSPYPLELRRRAVRMVVEVRPQYDTEWAAMKPVGTALFSSAPGRVMLGEAGRSGSVTSRALIVRAWRRHCERGRPTGRKE
ncbi:hypothetical protein ACWGNN_30615 [Streptomyces sp. NPDC055817]